MSWRLTSCKSCKAIIDRWTWRCPKCGAEDPALRWWHYALGLLILIVFVAAIVP